MLLRLRTIILSMLVMQTIFSCTSSTSTTPGAGVERASEEYSTVLKATEALETAATSTNGLVNGSGLTVSRTAFNPATDCATSGWPATGTSGDVGYAMKFLLCSVLKSPDGPDTVRGGFDRIAGFLCAIGDVTYNDTPATVSVTFSTDCFSQTFVTTACTFINGSASDGPCSSEATVTGFSSVTGVAPAGFENYLTMTMLGGEINYTIAFTSTATVVAGACMGNLPTAPDNEVEDAFAFYIDATAGKMRYEGRFSGNNPRHMRINLIGAVSTDFAITNVETLSFVQGENFSSGTDGLIVSVHGTPSAGRKIRILQTSDTTAPTPVWSASNADDDTCIGEVGALCTANSGITAAGDSKFFFEAASGFTTAKTWFTNNSYLGTVSDTVDMEDIWD
jgi:hypothetical protein